MRSSPRVPICNFFLRRRKCHDTSRGVPVDMPAWIRIVDTATSWHKPHAELHKNSIILPDYTAYTLHYTYIRHIWTFKSCSNPPAFPITHHFPSSLASFDLHHRITSILHPLFRPLAFVYPLGKCTCVFNPHWTAWCSCWKCSEQWKPKQCHTFSVCHVKGFVPRFILREALMRHVKRQAEFRLQKIDRL